MSKLMRYVWPFNTSYANLPAGRVFAELRGIALAAVFWPVASGSLLLYSGLSLTEFQKWMGVTLVVPAGVLLLLIVGDRVLRKDFRPIRSFLESSSIEEMQQTGREAMVCARNFQLLSLRRILLFQAPAFGFGFSLMVFLGNQFFALEFELWQLLVALMVSSMVGIGHAAFEFYATAPLMHHVMALIREYGVELSATDMERIIRVDSKRKLMFVSGLIMSGPMLILGITLMIRIRHDLLLASLVEHADAILSDQTGWILLIVAVASLMALMISLRMAHDIASSAHELSSAMQQVENGHLDVMLMEKSSDEYSDIFKRFNRMVHQLQERERLHDAFGRYVSRELTEDVMKHGINLGGQTLPVTIMFTDLRGFSAISESLPPEQVVEMLNIYMDEMTQVIFKHGGTINELMGDGLLIVFGAPTTSDDDADRALACALEMQLTMPKVNQRITSMGYPELEMGIGINSGRVVAGNVGSEMRTKYAVVGSAVNMAARVESFTVGGQVLATRATLDMGAAELNVAGEFSTTFKGIREPVAMYDIVGIGRPYDLHLPKLEIAFHSLTEAIPLEFEVVEGKSSDSVTKPGRMVALSENEKYAIVSTAESLDVRSNIKISLQTPLLPDNSHVYAKIMNVCDDGSYEVNFTYMSKNTRNFLGGLKAAESA